MRQSTVLRFLLLISVFTYACTTSNPSHQNIAEVVQNKVIYEINIRQYSPEGTFDAITKDLPRLKELGVDILWLMPIHPIGELNRKGSLGSYYAVKDYTAVNPEFGSDNDFKNLVDAAHEKGFLVIIDWVANHTAWDNVWYQSNPDWFTKNENGDPIPPVEDWSDVMDLNYDNYDMRNAMTSAMKYWVSEFDIDGFRCDVAGMVPTAFWDSTRVELDKIKPVFMLAESEEPELNAKAFHMSYGWNMHHEFNMIAQVKEKAEKIVEVQTRYDIEFPKGTIFMNFTSNHDENTWNGTVFERMGDAHKTMTALSYILPGMPLIYSGQEAPMKKRLKFFEKDEIDWNGCEYQDFYRKLNQLKHNTAALNHGENAGSHCLETIGESVLFITRQKGKSHIKAIFNLSDEQVEINPKELIGEYSSFNEYFSNTTLDDKTLEPWEYVVFRK